MAILKCKKCGGNLIVDQDVTYGICEYCGSTQTFPGNLTDERTEAFNRAEYFRQIGDFDQAVSCYEAILAENDADAEAHWGAAISRFGITYVKDPATLQYMPTLQRLSLDSFKEDLDFQAALAHSDGVTWRQYQKEANQIWEAQQQVLTVSRNEKPYDVFLCYKEQDENGRRTPDSVKAEELYEALTAEGYRVFFARISLEDKAGKKYEPYIFAALTSAKVMAVVGSRQAYFNAPWVKNEWSRFLVMMKQGKEKVLIPCYLDMDPYDMPQELAPLQSFDMAQIGFQQDMIRIVRRVCSQEQHEADELPEQQNQPVTLLEHLEMALEQIRQEQWKEACETLDEAMDVELECAEIYFLLMLAQLHLDPGKIPYYASKLGQYAPEMTQTELNYLTRETAGNCFAVYLLGGEMERISTLIEKIPSAVNMILPIGKDHNNSLLNYAISVGNWSAVCRLLSHGTDPNQVYRRTYEDGCMKQIPPIHEALRMDDDADILNMLDLLASYDADMTVPLQGTQANGETFTQSLTEDAASLKLHKSLIYLLEA